METEYIETQMMIDNHVFSIEINDISKDGIGFIFSSERSMLGLAGKSVYPYDISADS